MGTITSFIFVGNAHPNDNGLLSSNYCILLREGDKPVFEFQKQDTSKKSFFLIPTLENMLDDLILGVLFYYFNGEKEINEKLGQAFLGNIEINSLEMYDIPISKRKNLYDSLKSMNLSFFKIVINNLEDSHLNYFIQNIYSYSFDYEVTKTIVSNNSNRWKEYNSKGKKFLKNPFKK